jgi:hypothetical protein
MSDLSPQSDPKADIVRPLPLSRFYEYTPLAELMSVHIRLQELPRADRSALVSDRPGAGAGLRVRVRPCSH